MSCAGYCEEAAADDSTCEGYQPVQSSTGEDVVVGTAAFEGYLAGALYSRSSTSMHHFKFRQSHVSLLQRTFTEAEFLHASTDLNLPEVSLLMLLQMKRAPRT